MHVLVEPGKPSKVVPCVVCGEMCEAHAFAATQWVKCPAHMKKRALKERRSSTLDPFEPGIPLEDRRRRIVGAVLVLKRKVDSVEWEETVTATGIASYDEERDEYRLWAVGGSSTGMKNFDPRRECGQSIHIKREEVISVR